MNSPVGVGTQDFFGAAMESQEAVEKGGILEMGQNGPQPPV